MASNPSIDPESIDNAYDPDAKLVDTRQASPYTDNVVEEEPVFDPNASMSEMSRLSYDDNSTHTSATPRREFKYSTANIKTRSRCWKFLLIAILFAIFMAISIGISMLIQHLFFGGESDNGPPEPTVRSENDTFPEDKVFIDQVCSPGTMDLDEGARCRDACEPRFTHCCDPFKETELYFDTFFNETNSTEPLDGEFDDIVFKEQAETCSFDSNTRGCMSYSKCQALSGIADPAPATLPVICSPHFLQQDSESCEELCRPVRCCFSDVDNCLAENLPVCMDYSPCQNLRSGRILQAAPDDLDRACLLQLPECFETCERAECCGDPESTCFQENFLACMTYAPCHNITQTSVSVAQQFSVLDPPTNDLILACNRGRAEEYGISGSTNTTCEESCAPAMCCYAADPGENCFRDDPLGCLAYNQECQVLFYSEDAGASAGGITITTDGI